MTSLSSRSALRCTVSSDSPWSAPSGAATASSMGPSISVSGVRNSWLTFGKKVGLRAVERLTLSARRFSVSTARALWIARVNCAATRS